MAKKRWVQVVSGLSRAFALCAETDEATELCHDVSFFQALQAAFNKQNSNNGKTPEQIDAAIRQLVSSAVTTDGQVIDVFTAAGLSKPDISILSDEVLTEVRVSSTRMWRRVVGEVAQGRDQDAVEAESCAGAGVQ